MTRPKPASVGVDSLLEKGLASHRAGDVETAERCYAQALRRAPKHATAWYLRSVVAMSAGRYADAARMLERAVEFGGDNAVTLCNLGEAYRRSGRIESAIATLRRVTQANPGFAAAHYNLGVALRSTRRFEEAVAAYETAAALEPSLPGLALEIVGTYKELGREDVAISAYLRLSKTLPDDALARIAIAEIYAANFRFDEAEAHYARALELAPGSARVHASYAVVLADGGDVDAAVRHYRTALELDPDDQVAHGNLLFTLSFHPEYEGPAIVAEARAFASKHAAGIQPAVHVPSRDAAERKLRVGYVSPDFRRHAIAHFMLPLIRHHDRTQVEVYCYANVERPDTVTDGFRKHADVYRDIYALDDERAAALIRDDAVDILVDLAMHTANNRLGLFARKPAPVQVSYLAYVGTTGMPAMDYRLTAPRLEPPSTVEHYTEKSVELERTYYCYDPLATEPEVGPLPAASAPYLTFGSLNAFRKLNARTIGAWAAVLRAVPESRMLVHAPPGRAVTVVREAFERGGVEPRRVDFVGRMTREEYLAAYHRIDVCLDTQPFNGATTTLDAYWMGVPVLGLIGTTAPGRVSYALSAEVGLEAFFVRDRSELIARAVDLSRNIEALAELRSKLRARLSQSALMDGPSFACSFERACRLMWREWCSRA